MTRMARERGTSWRRVGAACVAAACRVSWSRSVVRSGATVALVALACTRSDHPPLPSVDLGDVEPALAAAISAARSDVEARPRSAATWSRLGIVLDIHDFRTEAIACYAQAESLDQDDFRWPYFRGLCEMIGDQTAALAQFDRAAELNPEYAPIHVYRGRGLLLLGRLDEAQDAYERVARLDPSLIRAHIGLAKVSLARGHVDSAIAHLERALDLGPKTGEADRLLAAAYQRQGDPELAATHARRAASSSSDARFEPIPDRVRASLEWEHGVTLQWRRKRAQTYVERGQLEAALAEWQAAARDAPASLEVARELGDIYSRLGRHAEAIPHYERVIEEDPQSATVRVQLANALANTQRHEEAIAVLERALEIDPALHAARSNLGALLVAAGRADEGIEHLEEAARALPDEGAVQLNLAMALKQAGRREAALVALQRTLELMPDHLRSRFEYGVLLAESGRLEEAIPAFRTVVKTDPSRIFAHVNLVRALHETGRVDEALHACRRGLEHVPGQPQLVNYQAWFLATHPDAAQRDGERALALATALAERRDPPAPEVLETLAAASAETGDFDAALRYARQAQRLAEASPAPRSRVVERLESAIARYEVGHPYRDRRR